MRIAVVQFIRAAIAIVGILGAVMVASCGDGAPAARSPGPLRIVVTIAPLTGLVKALAPPDAQVTTLVPPGRSLHAYEMTPGDVAALSQADLVVYVGLGLEPKVVQFMADHHSSNRVAICFADAAGIKAPTDLPEPGEHDADHDDDGHHHGVIDPHIWLDPSLVLRLLPAVRGGMEDALSRAAVLTEASRSRLTDAETALAAQVRQVDDEYRSRLAPFAGASIVTHHSAWSRLAERYGLKVAAVIRPIESEETTSGQLDAAIAAVKKGGARAVFFEPQFNPAAAERIALGAGVKLGRLDPEGDKDWFRLMRANLDELTRLLVKP